MIRTFDGGNADITYSLSGPRVLEPANTKPVFEASSKKHSSFSETNKKAPRLSLISAKMLLLQRAGLAPASTPHSVPSGDFNVAENAKEVKQNLLK